MLLRFHVVQLFAASNRTAVTTRSPAISYIAHNLCPPRKQLQLKPPLALPPHKELRKRLDGPMRPTRFLLRSDSSTWRGVFQCTVNLSKDTAGLDLQRYHSRPHLDNQKCVVSRRPTRTPNNASGHDLAMPVCDALCDRSSLASSFMPRAG